MNGGKNIHNIAFRGEASLSDWIFPNTRLGEPYFQMNNQLNDRFIVNFYLSHSSNFSISVSIDTMDETPDIVAIGVEELVDLNASNMVKARYNCIICFFFRLIHTFY